MPRFYDTCAGPIDGLYLPPIAWAVLKREEIHTLEQLAGLADRLEHVEGIEPRMAEVIREALARVASPEERVFHEMPLGAIGPWCA
ncbi:hypothetical protein [Microvirga sesbaniae]|uniref:hypothetical protein n=1 Tax=Microvirga sesbaniae TaxID=681392 RepID=UPI0021C744BE|nr:hypothetical protein [Microvirga sp. HBU67692]